MPYSIVTDHPECSGYAVIKDADRELLGCHRTINQAEAQLTALNIAEYGQRGDPGRSWAENIVEQNRNDDEYEDRALPDNYRPASSEDVPEGRNCANCIFNLNLYCTKWQAPIAANYYCNAWQPMETRKQKALDILEKLYSVRYNLTKS